jgi:hypothetical protein
MENDFKYSLRYNDYGDYSCEESGCHDEGICRCYRINEIQINSVNISSITESIFIQLHKNDSRHKRDKALTNILYDYDIDLVNKYCIHRVLTICKIWDIDNWNAKVTGGYYGDEVGDISIEEDIFKEVSKHIDSIMDLETLKDKIDYVLKLEYGFILDKIKDKDYHIVVVESNDLDFGQDKHYKNVLHKTLDYYSDREYLGNSIRGVAYLDNGKWRVVDGYHRLTQTKFPKVMIIGIK